MQIHTICSAQFVEKILQAEVQPVRKGMDLTFRTDQAALDRLCRNSVWQNHPVYR
jgi:hypothetical protein